MILLRAYTLHTWYYCAHTHCTHGIIAHMKQKNRIYILYTGYYYTHIDCTYRSHDFIAHIHIAHIKDNIIAHIK